MEFIVIIELSQSTANNLNIRQSNGLQIIGEHEFRELNNSKQIHRWIQSRVFYASDVTPGEKYKIILGERTSPESETEFTIPGDKEYEIVNFPESEN